MDPWLHDVRKCFENTFPRVNFLEAKDNETYKLYKVNYCTFLLLVPRLRVRQERPRLLTKTQSTRGSPDGKSSGTANGDFKAQLPVFIQTLGIDRRENHSF